MIPLARGGTLRFPSHCVHHIEIRFRREASDVSCTRPGNTFFHSMLRMWLGEQPADGVLKNALLGRAAV
jgi:hypothetical protein